MKVWFQIKSEIKSKKGVIKLFFHYISLISVMFLTKWSLFLLIPCNLSEIMSILYSLSEIMSILYNLSDIMSIPYNLSEIMYIPYNLSEIMCIPYNLRKIMKIFHIT